jgi:hypothetical protein
MTTTTKRRLFHGYPVLLSTFLLKFVAIGAFNSSGLYLGPLSTSFPSCNGGYLAFYCTIQLASGLASSFVGGTLQEVLEAHNVGFQWLFFGGGIFMTLGLLLSSYSISITILLVGALLTGVGLGLCGFLAGGICVLWFEEHRGTMLLLAMSGEGIGNIFFSWLTAKLLEVFGSSSMKLSNDDDKDDAWRPVMRCVAVLSFILCSVASTSMRLPVSGEVEEHEKNQRKLKMEGAATRTSDADDDDDNGQQTTVLMWEESDDDDDDDNIPSEYGAVNASRSLSENDAHHHHMHINMKRTRASIIEKERKNPLTMIATYEALGEAHLIPKGSPPSHRPSKRLSKQRFMAAVSTVVASQRFGKAIADTDDDDDEDEPTLSLGEVALSQTNIWLCAFSFISCFSILNLQVLLASYTSSLG